MFRIITRLELISQYLHPYDDRILKHARRNKVGYLQAGRKRWKQQPQTKAEPIQRETHEEIEIPADLLYEPSIPRPRIIHPTVVGT